MMARLGLISMGARWQTLLSERLAGSDWSVTPVDLAARLEPGSMPDVLGIEGSHPDLDVWEPPRGVPILILAASGAAPPSTILGDDVIFEDATADEWVARLDRLRDRVPLEALRHQYEETLASMAPGVVVIDPALDIVFANPRAYEIVGHHEGTLGKGNLGPVLVEDDAGRIRDTLAKGEYPRGMDVRLVRREGRQIECTASFAPLIGAEDHTVVSFEDVTKERQTERELLKTMRFLESLIDASVDAIIATDMSHRIVLFNPSAERITGRPTVDATANLTLDELLGRASAELVTQRLAMDEYGGRGRLEPTLLELTNVHGVAVPVQLSASTIDEGDEPSGIVLIFTDLSERVRVEERLAEAQKRLAFSNKQGVLAELAGTAAHELNQPLTSMMAYAELLLRQSEAGSVGAKAAEVLIREAERMAEIVRKIGKITKYETTSYVGQQKIFDLDRAADPSPSEGGPEH